MPRSARAPQPTIFRKMSPKEIFVLRQQPKQWLASARSLRDAAESIFIDQALVERKFHGDTRTAPKQEIMPGVFLATMVEVPNYAPAQMLYAYAMENLLKGIQVSNNPSLVSEDRLSKTLNTHNLLCLAKEAGLTITRGHERRILDTLQWISQWGGRYPSAIRSNDMMPPGDDGELINPVLFQWQEDHPIIRILYTRFEAVLVDRIRPPGPNG